MIDYHDALAGPLERCQVCGSSDLRPVIDLGNQPPCAALLSAQQLRWPEVHYPLRLNQCERCTLAQLDYVVPHCIVYPDDYPYAAGISWPVVEAHKQMAGRIVERFGIGLCVDVGSNDGTLLKQFAALGCAVAGVEPTGIADIAKAAGVPTIQAPFTEKVAQTIGRGAAHVITFTNVFAHMASLGEVVRGICTLLADDGVLVIENHYLLDILERNQFDSIYHEHIRTYTLRALVRLFEQYDLDVFDVERVPRYGGNIRVYVCWKGQRPIGASVGALLRHEHEQGVSDPQVWRRFRQQVFRARDEFRQRIAGKYVVGCSAPGRASTLLNFYGVTADDIRYTGEIPGSLKVGKYIPGCHIPIAPNTRLLDDTPERIVLLAWHYADEIEARLRREGVHARLLVPLPTVTER